MNAKIFLIGFISACTAYAADPPSQFNSTMFNSFPLTESQRMQIFSATKRDVPAIKLGKSDFVFKGPLVEGFRRLPYDENLSRGQRFLRLPLIRLFVPGPMERPPETGGKYFKWRSDECSVPWTKAASRPEVVKGPESHPVAAGNSDIQRGMLNIQLKKHESVNSPSKK